MPDIKQINSKKSKILTYLLASIVVLFGIILIFIGHLLKDVKPEFIPLLCTTIGIAFIVSISTTIVHRYFIYSTHYKETLLNMEEKLNRLLESRLDILSSSAKAGIRKIYPKWTKFCENVLPEYLEFLENKFVVVGVGLSHLSQLFVGGSLKKLIDKHLKNGREFTFCLIMPDSSAASYRESELGVLGSTNFAVKSSIAYLKDIERVNPGCKLKIKTIEKIVPKAVMMLIDDETIFFSPYMSWARTTSSWVIETNQHDEFYQKLEQEINHLLKNAEDYHWELTETNNAKVKQISE